MSPRVPWLAAAIAATTIAGYALAAPSTAPSSTTAITIWNTPTTLAAVYGGISYGGSAPPSGAMITLHRELDLGANGDVRIAGVPMTIDAASVQLRSLGDPSGIAVSEQRFVPGATSPDEILAHHVGDPVTVVTTKGEVAGVLRSVDADTLVLEVGAADQRHLQLMRREGYVLDVKLPPGPALDQASLVWHVAAKKPGKQAVEISYRADGLTWTADYLAILDDAAHTIDLAAWATIHNATGATFDDAQLTLVNSNDAATAPGAATAPSRAPAPPPTTFVVPSAVRLAAGESVQVALIAPRPAAKARTIVLYEAQVDQAPNFQAFPATDCNQFNAQAPGVGRAEVALEVDVPIAQALPDGRVRLFRRTRGVDRLDLISEDPIRTSPGVARIRLATDTDVLGTRRAVSCALDEHAHTIREKIEVALENKGTQAIDVAVREFLFRWPVARIESEDVKGVPAGAQTREYRVHLAAAGKQTLSYTVVYTW